LNKGQGLRAEAKKTPLKRMKSVCHRYSGPTTDSLHAHRRKGRPIRAAAAWKE
jgi:hypothetical protein